MADYLKLDAADSVAVALKTLAAGTEVALAGERVTLREQIERGHKFAVRDIPAGADVIKYGSPIGHATAAIGAGAWVHTHNLMTNLGPDLEYEYRPASKRLGPGQQPGETPPSPGQRARTSRTFNGYRRQGGGAGIRNDLYIVPTVGCINRLCEAIARRFEFEHGGGAFDSVIVTGHPYGCSQLGGDLERTRRLLQAIVAHPNAGGVLVVGLGCENNQIEELRAGLSGHDPARVRFMVAQQVEDEYEQAAVLLEDLESVAALDQRVPLPLSELRIGLKCGGSDGLSGITANPLVGRLADHMVAAGASVVLTEVPEMFGAEQLLMERARDRQTFDRIVALIDGFKGYFRRYSMPIYENPSPGNKAGGITTLEEKSLGCTQKSGSSEVEDVLDYGDRTRMPGLSLLEAPGNDLVSSTALAAAGCQMVLFTTGRGTPFGTFVPTVKIATNTELAQHKPGWIDFDAGQLLARPTDEVLGDLIELVIDVANGKSARNELGHMQEIAIFKDGVTE
jgi:altronate hydrolase